MNNDRPVKWILIGDEIRLSHALYHRYLLEKNEYKCDGGGIVKLDKENKKVIFGGISDDFGKANEKDFYRALSINRDDVDRYLFFAFREDTEDYEIIFE